MAIETESRTGPNHDDGLPGQCDEGIAPGLGHGDPAAVGWRTAAIRPRSAFSAST